MDVKVHAVRLGTYRIYILTSSSNFGLSLTMPKKALDAFNLRVCMCLTFGDVLLPNFLAAAIR